MDARLKLSAYYLNKSKLAKEDSQEENDLEDELGFQLDKTLFKVFDGMSDDAFVNSFLTLLKRIGDKEAYEELRRDIYRNKGVYAVDSLAELLEEEPSLIDTFVEKAMDMLDKNAPKGYTFYGDSEGRYGFWRD